MRNAFKASRKWLGGAGGKQTGAEDTGHLPGDAMFWGEPPKKGEHAREIRGHHDQADGETNAKVFARNQGAGINVGLEANQQRGRELQGLWGAARSSPSPGRRSAFYSRINFSRASVVVFLRFVNFIQNTLYFKANLDVGGWLQTSNFSVRRGNEPLILTMMTCLENSSDCSFSA